MAKNSDKNRLLERRRVQLLHAIRNESNHDALEKLVSALLQAVSSVIKKHHVRYHPFQNCDQNSEWKTVTDHWSRMKTDDVIAIVSKWRERPSYMDILHACDDKPSSSIHDIAQDIG